MILSLFQWLSNALTETTSIAILASFIWGVISVLLSPCHLASIPLIIGFIDNQGIIKTKRAFLISSLFSFGILLTIIIIGVITSLMGRMLGDVGTWSNYFVSVVFFIVGLHLLDYVSIPFLDPAPVKMKRKGFLAAFILGLIFGIALGPCTFAYMAPVLGVTFTAAKTNIFYATSLLVAYGMGHCSIIVFAGTFTEIVQHYLNWNEKSKGTIIIKKVCGFLVLLGGIYLIISAGK